MREAEATGEDPDSGGELQAEERAEAGPSRREGSVLKSPVGLLLSPVWHRDPPRLDGPGLSRCTVIRQLILRSKSIL